jgi:Carboxypeptidase regulatory-like domain
VGPDSRVNGQVVRSDNSPKANAKVMFINAMTGKRQTIQANTAGRFNIDLPAGSWHMYLHGADDQPIYQSRIDVNGAQERQVNLVSRSN